MSKNNKLLLTLAVVILMGVGVFFGMAQASPTRTPGFGASGDWGFTGGTGGAIKTVPVPISAPIPQRAPGLPTPGFGITG